MTSKDNDIEGGPLAKGPSGVQLCNIPFINPVTPTPEFSIAMWTVWQIQVDHNTLQDEHSQWETALIPSRFLQPQLRLAEASR